MIAVECYADTRLVLALGATKASVKHAKGKGHVLDILRDGKATLGIVDEDPGASEYPQMRGYNVAERRGSLCLFRHPDGTDRRVVVISPRLEEWLLSRAKASGIEPSKFGMASDPHKLHGSGRYDLHPKFGSFLAELLRSDPEVQQLRSWMQPR